MERLRYPDPFLEVRVEQLDLPFPSQSLCAGYEGGVWRASQLADHLFQWLPYAALNQEHQLSFGASNFVELLQLAATHVYNTRKTASRGELGELLFHLIGVLYHGTFPVVCKLVLKTAPNDTVMLLSSTDAGTRMKVAMCSSGPTRQNRGMEAYQPFR